MAGEDKIFSRHFFLPPFYLAEKIILAIILWEDKKNADHFFKSDKIL